MFNINFRVRDKHLAEALRLLEGKAIDLDVRPAKRIVDATPRVDGRASIENAIATFDAPFTAKDLELKGFSRSGAYNALVRLKKRGIVASAGKGLWRKKEAK